VSFRIVTTPLGGRPPALPEPRDGGFDAGIVPAFLPGPGVAEQVARLRQPGALAVTTGQQPALLGGPLYTLHKALAAAGLARTLEQRWHRPVVPVFWVAGDDHDWAEAAGAAWSDGSGKVVQARLRDRGPAEPMAPLWREPVGSEIADVLDLLERTLPASEHRGAALDWARRHFRPDRSLAAAFGDAVAELVAPFGVLCLDSTHRAVKQAASRHLVKALGLAADLERDLGRRAAALLDDGRDPGIEVGDGATLVMLDGPGGRDRLVRDGDGFVTRRGGERYSMAALQAIAAAEPQRLSANVLLRPVVESALLPTVAYCAGPGELRYLPLARPVFERMRVHRPLAQPRWSGVVIDAHVDRAIARFGLSLDELLDPAADVLARAARAHLSADTAAAIAGLRGDVTARYAAIRAGAASVDPTLVRPVEGAERRALDGLARVEAKLIRNLKRRHETELRQLARARESVLPRGRPQERIESIVSLLARHGPAAPAAIAEAAAGWYAAALEGRPVPA